MTVKKSTNPKKKYMAIFTDSESGKTKRSYFGQAGATDYLISKEKDRRARYIQRHKKDLETNDPTRPGYLALYLLWSYGNEKSTSLKTNINNYKKKFGFK